MVQTKKFGGGREKKTKKDFSLRKHSALPACAFNNIRASFFGKAQKNEPPPGTTHKIMAGERGGSYPLLLWAGTVLEPFWNRSGTVLEPFQNRSRTVPEPFQNRSRIAGFYERVPNGSRNVPEPFPNQIVRKRTGPTQFVSHEGSLPWLRRPGSFP